MDNGKRANAIQCIDDIVYLLLKTSEAINKACHWAHKDATFDIPFGFAAMKYVRWREAGKLHDRAKVKIEQLRTMIVVPLPQPDDLALSTLNSISDLFDLLPFNVTRVGTKGGPNPIMQQFCVDQTVFNQMETARLDVEHLLSEVSRFRIQLIGSQATQTST
jgi:hypothetical protein